ncbi:MULTISPECIES: replication initiation factor [unclassified Paenibacillus]|uniref:replication initiation factor n=1 Tax=unclassified Paenibacillus TaxID=185978 RepID=UPI00362C8391
MGLADCVKSFNNWFSKFNLQISETKLSRLDICADTDEAQFIENDRRGIVTRAKGIAIHGVDDSAYFQGKKFSGFVVGRNPLLARIYNKSLEIKKSAKVWFKDIWIKHGWNEKKDVWRVEFQLRGDVLKEYGIHTIDDVLPVEANLWSSLTQGWLTIRTPKDDNVSRWPIKRKWKVIQRAFLNQEACPLIRKKVIVGDSTRTLNQIAGLVITLAARNEFEDTPEALNIVDNWIQRKQDQKNSTFQAETNLRKLRFIQT